ncbi:MAG: BolA/IbaG family iron-sulfur metabolism protein [Alphaproteobacteria bacterium]
MDAATLEALIRAGLPGATVRVEDVRGDGNHYAATVITPLFEGKTRVEQHRMVFKALEGRIGEELHALQLTTRAGQGNI